MGNGKSRVKIIKNTATKVGRITTDSAVIQTKSSRVVDPTTVASRVVIADGTVSNRKVSRIADTTSIEMIADGTVVDR
jgi:hypothetical protein